MAKSFQEVEGGYYDDMNFYILPNEKGNKHICNSYLLGFYDPDGYFFDKDGFDQFGGYYDNEGYYHPGEKNKHEFPDYKQHDQSDRKGKNTSGSTQ